LVPEGELNDKKRLVLLADDDTDIRTLVQLRLEKFGYRVIAVNDGAQALKAVQEHAPDLAILDVMMPKMTGIEVSMR